MVLSGKKKDPDFSAAWDEARSLALECKIDNLELVGMERAEEKSDYLLAYYLKAHKPEKYGDKLNIAGKIDLFNGLGIDQLISIAKRGSDQGGDPGGEE